MKKTIAVLIAAMTAVALLSGFQLADMEEPSAEPTGTWYLQEMKHGNMEMNAELIVSMNMDMVLTIEDDGTAVMSTNGESAEGSWNAEGQLFFGNREYSFEVTEETLKISQEGSTLLFGKNTEATDSANASGDSLINILDTVLGDISGNSLTEVLNGVSGDSLTGILNTILGNVSGNSLAEALGSISSGSLAEVLSSISSDPSTKVIVSISGDSLADLLGSLSGDSSGSINPEIYIQFEKAE